MSGADLEYAAMLARAGITPNSAQGYDAARLEQLGDEVGFTNEVTKAKEQIEAGLAVLQAKFDGTDETATLQAAVTAAAGKVLIIPRGKTVKSGKVTVPVLGITLQGEGKSSVIDFIDDGTAGACLLEALDGSNLIVENLSILSSNAVSRSSLYGHIRTRGWVGLYVRQVWFGKSPSCAIWTSSTTNFELSYLDIEDTFADGIHISRGSKHGTIAHIKGRDLGDDLIGINAYWGTGGIEYENIQDITVTDIKGQNIGNGTTAGRGVAVNGGDSISIRDVTIDGVSQAAVLVSRVTSETFDPSNISIEGIAAKNTGLVSSTGSTSGAVFMDYCDGGSIRNIYGDDQTVSIGTSAKGVVLDAAPTGHEMANAQESFDRQFMVATRAASTGNAFLTYFTSRTDRTVSNVRTICKTAAGATPTLCRVGIYEVATNGDITLVASSVNNTSLWSAVQTYTTALSAPYTLRRGRRYAFAVLCVTSATAPSLASATDLNDAAEAAVSPRMTGLLTALTDLPATRTSGTIGLIASRFYGAMV